MSSSVPDYLAKKHPHPRDYQIVFDEGPHTYTINGDSNYTSVTTWNHSHFQHFDADRIIEKMTNSWKWPESKYYGMTPEEIKAQWEQNGKEAREAGTKMHYDIECYYNDQHPENDSVEYQYFQNFVRDFPDLKPYRTEWTIWDEDLKIAGSIDMTFENENGTIEIYDWKRSKEIKMTNRWQSAETECISYIPDSNYWHYSLQLNTYKAILERKYDKKVEGMYLVCLHPDNENQNYQRIKVADLSPELELLIEKRLKDVNDSGDKET